MNTVFTETHYKHKMNQSKNHYINELDVTVTQLLYSEIRSFRVFSITHDSEELTVWHLGTVDI